MQFNEEAQELKLAELRRKQEEDFIQVAATKRGLPYINLQGAPIEPDALRAVPEADARLGKFAPFQIVDKKIGIAVLSPDYPETTEGVKKLTAAGFLVKTFIASQHSLEHAYAKYAEIRLGEKSDAGTFEISSEKIQESLSALHTVTDVAASVDRILTENKNARTTRVAEIILAGALATDASDVHFEPEEKSVRVRYRLDGVLNDALTLTHPVYMYILSRIKLISGLKLNVTGDAQDGRFSIHSGDEAIEVRTSVVPGAYGESIVLRILNPKSIGVGFDELGMEPHLRSVLEKEISKPNGMVLNTGPTGSGKTTTLYAFLKKVHTPDTKIITIEDPVEYHLKGIVQTQVNHEKGYDFLSGLRAALRQDPDIIMVGEIRDTETASTAINAANTGHLVFSTLHTNNAAGTFPRLVALGINPKVITSAINVAMAQRLARKLCNSCKKKSSPAKEEKELIDSILSQIPFEDYKTLPRDTVYEPVGCEKCNNTGFKGRIGIYEAILATNEIETAVSNNASEWEIAKIARAQGIMNMREDAVVKILNGVTSISEVRRVIDLDEKI